MKSKKNEEEKVQEQGSRIAIFALRGKTPLLMHSPKGMSAPRAGGRKTEVPPPKEEAEGGLYLDDEGAVLFPGIALRNAIVAASSAYKAKGRASMKGQVGHIMFTPEFVPLLKPNGKQYRIGEHEIDSRRAVVQRNGIVRSRPLFREWAANVGIVYDPLLVRADVLLTIAKDAGNRIGVLDYRPQRSGWFGRFEVSLVSDDAE